MSTSVYRLRVPRTSMPLLCAKSPLQNFTLKLIHVTGAMTISMNEKGNRLSVYTCLTFFRIDALTISPSTFVQWVYIITIWLCTKQTEMICIRSYDQCKLIVPEPFLWQFINCFSLTWTMYHVTCNHETSSLISKIKTLLNLHNRSHSFGFSMVL